jgi:autotransporter-associated beta strand protein
MLTNSGGGGAEVFTVNGSGTNSFSGSIGGIMSLTKSGSGTQILSGPSSYSGGTFIDGGKLIVNNAEGSGTGTGAVNVRTNGTLGGSGFIAGNVTNLGGVVAPGNSPGNLSVGGNFTATNFDSVAEFEIAGPGGFANAGVTYDLITIGGDVNIGASALSILTTPFAGGWQIGDQYRLINNLGANPIVGFFSDGVGGASLFQGSSIFVDGGGVELTLDYLGGTGNDLVLTVVAVPEPQTIGLMVIGGALCAWHVFRRRRQ